MTKLSEDRPLIVQPMSKEDDDGRIPQQVKEVFREHGITYVQHRYKKVAHADPYQHRAGVVEIPATSRSCNEEPGHYLGVVVPALLAATGIKNAGKERFNGCTGSLVHLGQAIHPALSAVLRGGQARARVLVDQGDLHVEILGHIYIGNANPRLMFAGVEGKPMVAVAVDFALERNIVELDCTVRRKLHLHAHPNRRFHGGRNACTKHRAVGSPRDEFHMAGGR